MRPRKNGKKSSERFVAASGRAPRNSMAVARAAGGRAGSNPPASPHRIEQARPVSINSGNLVWSGEHWIAYLREPSANADSGMVSLFHTRYSPAGEGTVAFVKIPGEGGVHAACADNREVAFFLIETFLRQGPSTWDPNVPIIDAKLTRAGDIREAPAWIIQTEQHRLVTRWHDIQSPVIAEGAFRQGTEHFTLLFFADSASIQFDNRDVPGKPYLRDIWKKTIGGDRSSCVFALAETYIEMPQRA